MRRFLTAFAAAVLMLSLGTANAAEYKKMTIRAATANPQGSLHVVAIDKFKEIVEKESNGAITVQTFYGGSLGDEQANVKQLRNAEIHLAVLADGNLTPFAPQAGVFILPYMFPKISDAEKLFGNEAFMNKTADAIAKQSRTRPLSWLVGGYRIITNSKKPINTMADLKGLKIRVPAVELQLAAFRSWGVEPHPLAWSETFNGLQQGVVDGQENPRHQPRPEVLGSPEVHHQHPLYALGRPDARERPVVPQARPADQGPRGKGRQGSRRLRMEVVRGTG